VQQIFAGHVNVNSTFFELLNSNGKSLWLYYRSWQVFSVKSIVFDPRSTLCIILINCTSSIDKIRQYCASVISSRTTGILVATYTKQRQDLEFQGFSTEDGLTVANDYNIPYREVSFDPNENTELLEMLSAGLDHLLAVYPPTSDNAQG
jgi:hypothetical protein